MDITYQPGEQKIDTWTVLYQPTGGGKFNGKLAVTNQRLLYDAKYDASVTGVLTQSVFIRWGSLGYLEINKSEIKDIAVEKSFLAKKVILTLADGSKHTFNYGALNIDKLVEAIKVGVAAQPA